MTVFREEEPTWGALDAPVAVQVLWTHAPDAGAGDELLQIPKHRVVLRTDTGRVLALVSSGYKLVKHREVVEPVHLSLKELHLKVQQVFIHVGAHGGTARVEWVLAEERGLVSHDDRVRFSLVVRNSYDKSSKISLTLGAWSIAQCNGGVGVLLGSIDQAEHTISWRHWRTLSLPSVMLACQSLLKRADSVVDTWRRWAEIKVEPDSFSVFCGALSLHAKRALGRNGVSVIMERIAQTEPTIWTVINAIGHFATHGLGSSAVAERRDQIHRVSTTYARWAEARYRDWTET